MVALFGRANWWPPGRLARFLRVPAAGHAVVVRGFWHLAWSTA